MNKLVLVGLCLPLWVVATGAGAFQPTADPSVASAPTPSVGRVITGARLIKGARFAALPNADQFAHYYPEKARLNRVEGMIKLSCTVTEQGTLEGCSVMSEDPAGYGFADAAIAVTRLFKLQPTTTDGTPVVGGVFTPMIHFKMQH